MIVQDLYRSIIEYVSLVDLKYLSSVSPVFDAEICKAGIRVFYENNNDIRSAYDLSGRILIKLNSGKRFVLESYNGSHKFVNDIGSVIVEDIKYIPGDVNCNFAKPLNSFPHYDRKHNVVVHKSPRAIYIQKNCGSIKLSRSSNISYVISDKPNLIDFNTSIAMYYEDHGILAEIQFEDFSVSFKDDKWC